ncbi:MAG: acylphosphatase [Desulfobacteraceae bacterium]|nr:acylphosphatase [Desulfobacteraceae bacterium]
MKKVRAHAVIDGRVQGVCFRMDTRLAAAERNIKGWVRNMRDGRVEAVLEGEENDVKSMLKWCEAGPPLARVNKVAVEWEPHTGQFDAFDITFA